MEEFKENLPELMRIKLLNFKGYEFNKCMELKSDLLHLLTFIEIEEQNNKALNTLTLFIKEYIIPNIKIFMVFDSTKESRRCFDLTKEMMIKSITEYLIIKIGING